MSSSSAITSVKTSKVYGVSCPKANGVAAILLPSNNLAGQLPSGVFSALANSLLYLDLGNNVIGG